MTKSWSTARHQQHLAYIPRNKGINPCYQALRQQGYESEYSAVRDPALLAGLHRVEAQALAGPRPGPPTGSTTRQIAQIDEALRAIAVELQPPSVVPEALDEACSQLQQQLYDNAMQTFDEFKQQDSDATVFLQLLDGWLALLAERDPSLHDWASVCFLQWGDNGLQDLIAELVDGEAEKLIDEQYAECVEDIPRFTFQRQRSFLRQRKQKLEEQTQRIFPHRPVRKGTANAQERRATAQKVPNLL